jgi:LmbE family N-acetylglucosaminyl deacetylase
MMPFGSHLDDVGFLCFGTLARYRSGGHDVAIAVMTRGEVGSPSLSRDRIAAIREKEARASAVTFVRETP